MGAQKLREERHEGRVLSNAFDDVAHMATSHDVLGDPRSPKLPWKLVIPRPRTIGSLAVVACVRGPVHDDPARRYVWHPASLDCDATLNDFVAAP
jgi:hypothetical protein